jgi:predicted amidophosphoribosyltransferase
MAETTKCPKCGAENESAGRICAKCAAYIPSTAIAEAEARRAKLTLDYLRDIDASLKTIKHIAVWWLILSILSVLTGIFWFAMTH